MVNFCPVTTCGAALVEGEAALLPLPRVRRGARSALSESSRLRSHAELPVSRQRALRLRQVEGGQ